MAVIDGVAGLKLWLVGGVGMSTDTAGTTPVTTAGQAVARWADQSGNNAHVTQATVANRPLYRPAGTAGLDGTATAQGDATDLLDGGTGVLSFAGRPGMTVFAVLHQVGTSGAANFGIVARDASGNRGWSYAIDFLNGRAVFVVANTATTRNRRDGARLDCRNLPCVLTFRYNGGAGEQSIRVNGVDDTGVLDGTSPGIPATIGGNGAALRVFNNGFTEPCQGHLRELAIYDVAVSDANRNLIEADLLARHRLMAFGEVPAAVSPNLSPLHQGIAHGGGKYYTFHTDALHRRDAAWAVEATNPASLAGIGGSPAIDHGGDGDHHDGKLYVPIEQWTSCGDFSRGAIGVYDATSLARLAVVDVAAQGHEVAALAIDPDLGIVYVASYCDGSKLWKYRLADLTYIGSVTLSVTLLGVQGLAWRAGVLYVVEGRPSGGAAFPIGTLSRINPATGAVRACYHDNRVTASGINSEGIDFLTPTRLGWLFDNSNISLSVVNAFDVTYPPAPPTAGVATVTGTTTTTASLAATAATGAAHGSAWAYQWGRSADGGATWADVAGATGLTLTDTGLTTGTPYRYRLRATDGDNPPGIVHTAAVIATPDVAPAVIYFAGEALTVASSGPVYYAS